jgi:hypothetical protein
VAKVRRPALLVLSVHDRTSLSHVAAALHARGLSFVIGVGDARDLASDGEVVRVFATRRPHLLRRALGSKGRNGSSTPTAAERVVALAVWAAPLSAFRHEGGRPTSLLTIVEKGRRQGSEPLCLHLVTGEPVETRTEVAAVVDAYLKRVVRRGDREAPASPLEFVHS